MSDLFKKTEEISNKFFSNLAFKKESMTDKALNQAANMLFKLSEDQKAESERHVLASKQLQRKAISIHAANIILRGQPGYLRCAQGWNDLESGYTCLEEIVANLTEPMVDVSLERMNVSFGMELWHIDDRGMMTLIDSIRDTTD